MTWLRRNHCYVYYNTPFSDVEGVILKRSIENAVREKNVAFSRSREALRKMKNLCECYNVYQYFEPLCNKVKHMCDNQIRINKARLSKKLEKLFLDSKWCKYSREYCIVNLSNLQLSRSMSCVLVYGLSFCLPPNENVIIKFLSDFNSFEHKFGEMLDDSRDFILNDIIRNLGRKVLPTRLMSALRDLKRNKDIVITKADEGNKVVILNRDVYEEKLRSVLSDESVYCKLNNNPLKIWQAEYNRNLKSIFANMASLFNRFESYLPSLPYMYALPKIHKADRPPRPIIAPVNSVTYSLSKYLSSLLKPLIGTISSSHIINSTVFVEKIRAMY